MGIRDIIAVNMHALDHIQEEEYRDMKLGIMLDDSIPHDISQLSLFSEDRPRANSAKRIRLIDGITSPDWEHLICRTGYEHAVTDEKEYATAGI
ncbi:hypothetical protein [Kosakonia sp. S42]|uniref:hypothetical protein n=1 Tax=Kosakonia sp. S42 TaxID=2767458 RepID=UPI00190AEB9E|nr:hypothetical protein [Kosakonia sp. S42]MBK0019581.1 hypothetical protein [Kosakonia sp. S42]